MLDTNRKIFITYDTRGYDWTIRAWDLAKLDTGTNNSHLLSSFTCPTRIISCSINVDHLTSRTSEANNFGELLIGVALYGIQQPLILKLSNQIVSGVKSMQSNAENNSDQLFSKIDYYNKEINL